MTEEKTDKQKYYIAMREYLKARGEIQFAEKGYKKDIASIDTIIATQYFLVQEYGFIIEQGIETDDQYVDFVVTEIEHEYGYKRVLKEPRPRWAVYPDGYEKQYNEAFNKQSGKTYIERNQLCDLLYIERGFNPEKEWADMEARAGKVEYINEDQIKELSEALKGDVKAWNSIQRLKKVKEVSHILAEDFDEIMNDLNPKEEK